MTESELFQPVDARRRGPGAPDATCSPRAARASARCATTGSPSSRTGRRRSSSSASSSAASTDDLKAEGWGVLSISLQKLLLDRIRATGRRRGSTRSIARERRSSTRRDPGAERARTTSARPIAPHIEGPNGIAADVVRLIDGFAAASPEDADRTLVLLGRAGALYPFFRSSALLKHIDGKTRNIPVVLLYPGERRDTTALSFMGELPADRDYRPRIYP